jgi:hypothetical protein
MGARNILGKGDDPQEPPLRAQKHTGTRNILGKAGDTLSNPAAHTRP